MADYAATPIQLLAHGLITIDAAGDPAITGRGFGTIERGVSAQGDFIVTFDEGSIAMDVSSGPIVNQPGGNGLPDGRVGPNGLDPRKARIAMTMRGGTTAPGLTTLSPRSAEVTAIAGVTTIEVVVVNDADTPTDPMGAGAPNADGGGIEIIVWYGGAAPDDVTQQVVGPLFQPAMAFP